MPHETKPFPLLIYNRTYSWRVQVLLSSPRVRTYSTGGSVCYTFLINCSSTSKINSQCTVYLFTIVLVRDAKLWKVHHIQCGQHVGRINTLPGKYGHRVAQPDALQPAVHQTHPLFLLCSMRLGSLGPNWRNPVRRQNQAVPPLVPNSTAQTYAPGSGSKLCKRQTPLVRTYFTLSPGEATLYRTLCTRVTK